MTVEAEVGVVPSQARDARGQQNLKEAGKDLGLDL